MHLSLDRARAFADFGVAFNMFLSKEMALSERPLHEDRLENNAVYKRNMQNGLIVEETKLSMRLGMMLLIFCVSLFASSFPTLSKRASYFQIPRAFFFIGKHFGTGVILSTAFVHLLQDAFECLQDPEVRKETNIGKWTGLIILGSLVTIFTIEYISTSYVDRLQSYPSAPPSPKLEPTPSLPIYEYATPVRPASPISSNETIRPSQHPSETTPLLSPNSSRPTQPARRYSLSNPKVNGHVHVHDQEILEGHHRHELRCSHDEHHGPPPRGSIPLFGEELEDPHHHYYHHHSHFHRHEHEHGHVHANLEIVGDEANEECVHERSDEELEIGRKRQVVGILVLQLGIMIHSLVIGLTLSIASGADFTSLVTAIVFHQLFEGLSLGIRIAGLPGGASPAPASVPFLKSILAMLFAVTTPSGIIIGLLAFGVDSGKETVHLKLIEGVMSAISAGMLVYAACVEMLAGDFVLDPSLWRSGIAKQATALLSLFAGVVAMACIG
ncbi:hypothetical protein EW146_g4496 [Bondarzewia mesenterica]|uniref:Zinc/iron permease n=1 Tax=Bondarzewia mesenterica TaxID=1095465 RepID=A0A4V3XF40_9AGAM|nr:hypothetical protein EW146_g4496 [Bondarzewia mesenterica]